MRAYLELLEVALVILELLEPQVAQGLETVEVAHLY
jgi:hypothetical protein